MSPNHPQNMKSINRYFKTEIAPNKSQLAKLQQAAGDARDIWNWGLGQKIKAMEAYKAHLAAGGSDKDAPKLPTAIDLHKEVVVLKHLDKAEGGKPWLKNTSKEVPQNALRDLDKAFRKFWNARKKKSKRKVGFPKFKAKYFVRPAFRCDGGYATGTHVHIPRIGKVRLKEKGYLPVRGEDPNIKINHLAITSRAGRWFASLNVTLLVPKKPAPKPRRVTGVDVGIKTLATCSDGITYANPRALKRHGERLRLLQKSVSRKKKGSANRRKAVALLAKQHYKISCVRQDAIHKATSEIVKRSSHVVIEDLNVAGMMKNRKLAKAVVDASMSEFLRTLRYKCDWAGVKLEVVDRFFPSSKKCYKCGNVKDNLSLSERRYVCDVCSWRCGRDENAALNLAASSAVWSANADSKACRPGGTVSTAFGEEMQPLVGQEENLAEVSFC